MIKKNFLLFFSPYKTISVDGLTDSVVLIQLQQQPLWNILHEIQILVGGNSLGSLLSWGAALVCWAFQVEFEVHPHRAWKQIVHDYDADVLTRSLNTVQSVKLW